MLLDLAHRQRRACGVAARRIADQRGEVADDEHHGVTQVLKLPKLPQRHGVAKVQVGCRGIDAQLDTKRRALRKLAPHLGGGDEAGDATLDDVQLLVGG